MRQYRSFAPTPIFLRKIGTARSAALESQDLSRSFPGRGTDEARAYR